MFCCFCLFGVGVVVATAALAALPPHPVFFLFFILLWFAFVCAERRATLGGVGCATLEDNDSLRWACLAPNTVLTCSSSGFDAVLSMELRVRASMEVHSAAVGSSSVLTES